MDPLLLDWKAGGLDNVNGSQFVADSELVAKIRARSKLCVRPDALHCPKTWGKVTARLVAVLDARKTSSR